MYVESTTDTHAMYVFEKYCQHEEIRGIHRHPTVFVNQAQPILSLGNQPHKMNPIILLQNEVEKIQCIICHELVSTDSTRENKCGTTIQT